MHGLHVGLAWAEKQAWLHDVQSITCTLLTKPWIAVDGACCLVLTSIYFEKDKCTMVIISSKECGACTVDWTKHSNHTEGRLCLDA